MPAYPSLIVVGYVVGLAATAAIPASWVMRPVLVAIVAPLILTALCWTLARDRHVAALLTALIVLVLGGFVMTALLLVAVVVFVAVLTAARSRQLVAPTLEPMTRGLNLLATVWLGSSVALAVPFAQRLDTVPVSDIPALDPGADTRNIYVLLLDGYARADTLSDLGMDNQPFLDDLGARGFEVADHSTGHYWGTSQVLVTMLHMRHLVDLGVKAPELVVDQQRLIRKLLDRPPAFRALEAIGYDIITSVSNGAAVTLAGVEQIDGGQLNEFESLLIQNSELDRLLSIVWPKLLYAQHAERIRGNFEHVKAIAADKSGPRLVFAHVMSPHAPLVFSADGGIDDPVPCFPESCRLEAGQSIHLQLPSAEFARRYTSQVRAVNSLTVNALDTIIREDPSGVIIVMSDHGHRYSDTDPSEWYRTFFAWRTPDRTDVFDETANAIDVFPALFAAYFGVHVPPLDDRQFTGGPGPLQPILLPQRVPTGD